MSPVALTREISPKLSQCELTHLQRNPIDINKAKEQHHKYEQALEKLGYTVKRIPPAPELPDGVFVEDTAVVFPEVAVITRPGAESRRPETKSMAAVLQKYRTLNHIKAPGTIDGGDVLTLGRNLYIGLSSRSNKEGIRQFSDYLKPFGYSVKSVEVKDCLHLKTSVAQIDDDLLLINPRWISPDTFPGFRCKEVHPDEPYGANVMRAGNKALCPKAFPHTQKWLNQLGYDVLVVDQSELAKAEAGLTCCSVIVH